MWTRPSLHQVLPRLSPRQLRSCAESRRSPRAERRLLRSDEEGQAPPAGLCRCRLGARDDRRSSKFVFFNARLNHLRRLHLPRDGSHSRAPRSPSASCLATLALPPPSANSATRGASSRPLIPALYRTRCLNAVLSITPSRLAACLPSGALAIFQLVASQASSAALAGHHPTRRPGSNTRHRQ